VLSVVAEKTKLAKENAQLNKIKNALSFDTNDLNFSTLFKANFEDDQCMERLHDVVRIIEGCLNCEYMLLREDCNEFGSYLVSKNEELRATSRRLFRAKFDVPLSHANELQKPINGDFMLEDLAARIMAGKTADTQRDLLSLVKNLGRCCYLRKGFIDLFKLYKWFLTSKAEDEKPSTELLHLGISALKSITNLLSHKGPAAYYDFTEQLTPIIPIGLRARISKGYSWMCWVRLEKNQKASSRELFSFLSTSRIGVEFQIVITRSSIGSVPDVAFRIKCIPEESQGGHAVEGTKFQLGRWHHIAISHNPGRMTAPSTYSVFIDGMLENTLNVPFPVIGTDLISITLGGYNGQMGPFYLFDQPLDHKQLLSLFSTGPEFSPPMQKINSSQVTIFPENLTIKPADTVANTSNNLKHHRISTAFALDPMAITESFCLQRGWGNIKAERVEGINIVTLPNQKSSLISIGGLPAVFYFLSPEWKGPPFLNDAQATEALRLLTTLLRESSSFQRQFFKMGPHCIKRLILNHIIPRHRTVHVLNAVKEILLIIQTVDPDPHKKVFTQGFHDLVFDIPYWSRSASGVQEELIQYVYTSLQVECDIKQWSIGDSISIVQILDAIRWFFPKAFEISLGRTANRNDAPLDVAQSLLNCVIPLLEIRKCLTDVEHSVFAATLANCKCDGLVSMLLSTYCSLCIVCGKSGAESIFQKVKKNRSMLWILLQKLKFDNQEIRIKVCKILLGWLSWEQHSTQVSTQTRVIQMQFLEEMGRMLGSLSPSSRTYAAMLDMLFGRVNLRSPQPEPSPVTGAELIANTAAIEGLTILIHGADSRLKTRALMDLLSLLKSNDRNRKLFGRQRKWSEWMVKLFGARKEDVTDEIVVSLVETILWNFLTQEELGFIAVHHFLRMIKFKIITTRLDFSTLRRLYELIAGVFAMVFDRLLRDSMKRHGKTHGVLADVSEFMGAKIVKNVFNALNFVENLCFNYSSSLIRLPSTLTNPADQHNSAEKINVEKFFKSEPVALETPTHGLSKYQVQGEYLCLGRLLVCTLKFVPWSKSRQGVLRRLLRFMSIVLPHPGCRALFTEIIAAVREVFLTRMSTRSPKDLKTVRIGYTFLKSAYDHFRSRGKGWERYSVECRRLLEELYKFWGLSLFKASESQQDAKNSDPRTSGMLSFMEAVDKFDTIAHHRHSLFVLFQHQKRFDYELDRSMKKLDRDLDTIQDKDQASDDKRRWLFKRYLRVCESDCKKMAHQNETRLTNTYARKKVEKREADSQIKKYMDFFHKDYETRFPEPEKTIHWMLDDTESPVRMRMMLQRNFKGDSHAEATNKKPTEERSKNIEVPAEGKICLEKLKNLHEPNHNLVKSEEPNFHDMDTGASQDSVGQDNEEFDDDELDDWIDIDEPTSSECYEKAKITGNVIYSSKATLIQPLSKISGQVILTDKQFIFEGHEYEENVITQNREDQARLRALERKRRDGLSLPPSSKERNPSWNKNSKEFQIDAKIEEETIESNAWTHFAIRQVLPRRYLLRETGLEIFVQNLRNHFFCFTSKKERNTVYGLLCQHSKNNLPYVISPKRLLHQKKLAERWRRWEISNFDYIMHLNTLAGRSYNDLTQYPVFPWILVDYTSKTIDLKDPSIYRDLSKPVGALNPKRLEEFRQRYMDSEQDSTFPPFMYGTHYSLAGTVLHYLNRMEPFSTLAINLQGGKFDLPDRLFHSIQLAWHLSYSNLSDVKELIPEFFYNPEFLLNSNGYDLGVRQDGEKVGDVILPPWAESPEEFVQVHREALESEYVSKHLHKWIDLIFGFKQRGIEAQKADNVFFYLTYAGAVNPDKIKDESLRAATLSQIYHFGQTPNQLFDLPHLSRMSRAECSVPELILPFKLPRKYKPIEIKDFRSDNPEVIQITRDGSLMVTVTRDRELMLFDMPQVNVSSSPQHYNRAAIAARTSDESVLHSAKSPYVMSQSWQMANLSNAIALSSNGCYCFTGGYVDGTIKGHDLTTNEVLCSIPGFQNGHADYITIITLGQDQTTLITGANDGTVVQWVVFAKSVHRDFVQKGKYPLLCRPHRLLSVHHGPVKDITINSRLGLVCTIADDSTIALYSTKKKQFIRQIFLDGAESDKKKKTEEDDWEDDNAQQLLKVLLVQTGFIIIHCFEEGNPQLKKFSLNGRVIKTETVQEIYFTMISDKAGKHIITGGQNCVVEFRRVSDLTVVQKLVAIEGRAGGVKRNLDRYRKVWDHLEEEVETLPTRNLKGFENSTLGIDELKGANPSKRSSIRRSNSRRRSRFGSMTLPSPGQRFRATRLGSFSMPSIHVGEESCIMHLHMDIANTILLVVVSDSQEETYKLLLYPLPNSRSRINTDQFFKIASKQLAEIKQRSISQSLSPTLADEHLDVGKEESLIIMNTPTQESSTAQFLPFKEIGKKLKHLVNSNS